MVKRAQSHTLWLVLGTVVCATLLAKWTWVFIAPKDATLPTTIAWKKSTAADHLFGEIPSANSSQLSNLGNVQLVGVFAHQTAGFAVLLVEGKQVGVGLGELVMPGMHLVETHSDYVLIERGGVKSRVDLPADKPSAGISHIHKAQNDSLSKAEPLAPLKQLSLQERTAMQQELDHFRRKP